MFTPRSHPVRKIVYTEITSRGSDLPHGAGGYAELAVLWRKKRNDGNYTRAKVRLHAREEEPCSLSPAEMVPAL